MRAVKRKIHGLAALTSLLFIAGFWTSTVVSELFMSSGAVAAVKQAIAYALIAFVPTMAVVGATGFSLGAKGQHPLIMAKRRRMPFIALNGLLIMVPAALFLNAQARTGTFDAMFYWVQGLELLVGAINLTLMGMNLRDGLALSRHTKPPVVR